MKRDHEETLFKNVVFHSTAGHFCKIQICEVLITDALDNQLGLRASLQVCRAVATAVLVCIEGEADKDSKCAVCTYICTV